MKITNLETFQIQPRWMILKVATDEGINGYGEPTLEGRTRTVAMAIKELEPYLIGQDPLKIEHHWQAIYRGTFYRGGPILLSALSGIEQALWDIKGKYYNVPVYEMLGGAVRSRIRMYCGCGGTTTEALVQNALSRKAEGFKAVKIAVDGPAREVDALSFIDLQVECLSALREAVGKDMDVAVDFHGRVGPAVAVQLAKAFEPYRPLFIEEPCLPENVDAMVTIARSTSIPVATGERLFTRWGFRQVLEKQAASILQPDICHAGGIFEAKKIAAMAETYYCSIAPHNPLGPVSLSACLQLDACTPNFLIQEHPGMPEKWDLGQGYLKRSFVVEDGYIFVPEGPGLGIEIDEDIVRERSYEGDWDTPRLVHEDDGSIAEW
jgi:galactonate dehydratase